MIISDINRVGETSQILESTFGAAVSGKIHPDGSATFTTPVDGGFRLRVEMTVDGDVEAYVSKEILQDIEVDSLRDLTLARVLKAAEEL